MRRYAMTGSACLAFAYASSCFGLVLIYKREQHPVAWAREHCINSPALGECIGDYEGWSFWKPGQPWVFLGFLSAVIALVCFVVAWRRVRKGASSEVVSEVVISTSDAA
ncbi:MAG: hypothetical protein ACJ73L_07520 [Actinomycetes bacterium]